QKLDTNKENIINAYSNLQVFQDMILHVHNPISDGYCGFRSLAVAFFKDEEKWKDVKFMMKSQLIKHRELYGNILGYDINRLMAVLSYLEPMCSMEFWFYSLECAQLASDAFNVPVIIFGTDPTTSLFFLPYNQKPGRRRKPVILQ
ncbi:15551_t:CDS:1, partial [Cetraspora pellucida]